VGRRYHENVHFYGTHTVDVDRELAKLDAGDSGSDEQAKLAAFNPARLLVGPGGRQGGGLQARSPARVQRTPVWRDKVSLLSDFGGTPGPRGGASGIGLVSQGEQPAAMAIARPTPSPSASRPPCVVVRARSPAAGR
jgi:hypothetical protein